MLPILDDETRKVSGTAARANKLAAVLRRLPSAQEMASVAYAGRAKRGWYRRSTAALVEEVGRSQAPRFAALIAALSPQTSVENNIATAAKAWGLWKRAGSPRDRAAIIDILARSVPGSKGIGSVLTAWINNSVAALNDETLSGPKVHSFAMNLSGFHDEVTNDAWMAAYAGIPQAALSASGPAPGKSLVYVALSIRTRQAAEVLNKRGTDFGGWTAAEVQECVWSWCKSLYGLADVHGAPSGRVQLTRGLHTHAHVAAAPDFATLLGNQTAALALLAGSTTDHEGSGIDKDGFVRHLDAAAKRLDAVRVARRKGRADPRQYRLSF